MEEHLIPHTLAYFEKRYQETFWKLPQETPRHKRHLSRPSSAAYFMQRIIGFLRSYQGKEINRVSTRVSK